MLNLTSKLLVWIQEELKARSSHSQRASVPVRLLMLKLAMGESEQPIDVTQSTELALQTYQRLSLFTALKQLENSGQIEVISSSGKYTRVADSMSGGEKRITNEFATLYTTLTKKGQLEAQRAARMISNSSITAENGLATVPAAGNKI